jgi:bifunctional non-homologous end joining protein LigD
VAKTKGKSTGKTAAATAAPPTDIPDDWRITDDELAALDALGKEGVWHANGVELKLTNLDKPLFEPREPDGGGPITKRELIRYFALIAPTMLWHLK